MSWLKEQISLVKPENTQETQEGTEAVVEQAPVNEPDVVETPTDSQSEEGVGVEGNEVNTEPTEQVNDKPVVDTVVEEPVQQAEVETPVEEPTKTKIEYKDWLEQNKDTLYNYLKEVNTNYTELPAEEVVKIKIARDNPQWTSQEVEDELADRYGIGLKKKEIDEDSMTDSEIEQVNKHNSEVEKALSKGHRLLKKDAKEYAEILEQGKKDINLPEFEFDIPKLEEKPLDPEKLNEELVRVANEYKEKEWIPTVKNALKDFNSIKKTVEFDNNGSKVVLDVDYKLSDKEKEELEGYLGDYVSHPSDRRYIDKDGKADMSAFIADKSQQIYIDSLLKTVAKESAAKAVQDLVKNGLINYEDAPTNAQVTPQMTEAQERVNQMWGSNKRSRK